MGIPVNAAYWKDNEAVLSAKETLLDFVRFQPERALGIRTPLLDEERSFLHTAGLDVVQCSVVKYKAEKHMEILGCIEGRITKEDDPYCGADLLLPVPQPVIRQLDRRHRDALVNHAFAMRRRKLVRAAEKAEQWQPAAVNLDERIAELERGYAHLMESVVLAPRLD